MQDEKLRVLVVEARFYNDLADALLAGATVLATGLTLATYCGLKAVA